MLLLRSLPQPRRSTSLTSAAFCDLRSWLQPSSRRFSTGGIHLDCSFGPPCRIHFHRIGLPKHTTSHKQSAKPGNDGKPPRKRRPNNDLSGICRVIHGGDCERKVLA